MYIKKPFFKGATVCNLNSNQNLNISKINFTNLKMSEAEINKQNIYKESEKKQKTNNINTKMFNAKSDFKKFIKDFANINC